MFPPCYNINSDRKLYKLKQIYNRKIKFFFAFICNILYHIEKSRRSGIFAIIALHVIPASEPETWLQQMADQVRHDVAICPS